MCFERFDFSGIRIQRPADGEVRGRKQQKETAEQKLDRQAKRGIVKNFRTRNTLVEINTKDVNGQLIAQLNMKFDSDLFQMMGLTPKLKISRTEHSQNNKF